MSRSGILQTAKNFRWLEALDAAGALDAPHSGEQLLGEEIMAPSRRRRRVVELGAPAPWCGRRRFNPPGHVNVNQIRSHHARPARTGTPTAPTNTART